MKLTKNEIIGITVSLVCAILRASINLIMERGSTFPISGFLGTFIGAIIATLLFTYLFNIVKKAIDKKPKTQRELFFNNISYVAGILLLLECATLYQFLKGH